MADGADLAVAASVAIEQRVSPLLWRALTGAGLVDRNAAWYDELHRDAMRCRAQAEILLPRFGALALEPLARAGLEVLAIKGLALADRYPEPGLRPMDDVDVLLPSELHAPAIAVLRSMGWRVALGASRARHEAVLFHPELPGLPLELHYELESRSCRSCRLSAKGLWRRRTPSTVAGTPAFGLPTDYEIVMLSSHMAKPFHLFRRLIWLVDLSVVIEGATTAGSPVDWHAVKEVAQRNRCLTAVATALTAATRLGVETPVDARTPTASRTRLAVVAPAVGHEWPTTTPSTQTMHRMQYAIIDDWRLRARLFIDAQTEANWRGAPARAAIGLGRAARTLWRLRRSEAGREEFHQLVKP